MAALQRPDSTDDMDELLRYFTIHVPLSRFPTPPPAAANSTVEGVENDPTTSESQGDLAGAAIHLVNQLPPSVCAGPPSVTLIHGWLARAELPLVIVACAASIISALSSRFPKEWQRQYLGRWVGPIDTWNGVGRVRGWKADQWCTSAYHGEVIVLAALSIATAYLDDKDRHPSHWSFTVGRGVFDNKQLNITVRCILNDLDHRLGHLCRPASIDCSLQAFKCAARLGVVPSGAIPARVRELPTRLPTPAQAAGPAALPTPEQRPSEPAAH